MSYAQYLFAFTRKLTRFKLFCWYCLLCRKKCILIFQCFTEISTTLNLNIKIVFIALREVFNLKLVFVIFLPPEWSLVSFGESYNLPWNQFWLSAHWVHTTSFSMSWTKVFVEAKFQEMLLLLSGLTLPFPWISESCLKIIFNLNFYF